jgi:hypothetical protein
VGGVGVVPNPGAPTPDTPHVQKVFVGARAPMQVRTVCSCRRPRSVPWWGGCELQEAQWLVTLTPFAGSAVARE